MSIADDDTGRLAALQKGWDRLWPAALRLWSPFTRLREPR
jgi:hypothetical protein